MHDLLKGHCPFGIELGRSSWWGLVGLHPMIDDELEILQLPFCLRFGMVTFYLGMTITIKYSAYCSDDETFQAAR